MTGDSGSPRPNKSVTRRRSGWGTTRQLLSRSCGPYTPHIIACAQQTATLLPSLPFAPSLSFCEPRCLSRTHVNPSAHTHSHGHTHARTDGEIYFYYLAQKTAHEQSSGAHDDCGTVFLSHSLGSWDRWWRLLCRFLFVVFLL